MIGSGHNSQEIAKLLHRSIKTIEIDPFNIRTKLRLKYGTELIRYAAAGFHKSVNKEYLESFLRIHENQEQDRKSLIRDLSHAANMKDMTHSTDRSQERSVEKQSSRSLETDFDFEPEI